MFRKLLLLFSLLLLPIHVHAQGAHRISQIISRGQGVQANVTPEAKILVCAQGTNCVTTVQVYSDIALNHVAPNPVIADLNGNFNYYIAAGCYDERYTYPGSPAQMGYNVCLNTGGSSGTIVEVNSTPISPASPANFVDTASVTWAFTGGQIKATAANPITFETGGAENADQTYLDLDAGSNVTVTNTSGGHVQISALVSEGLQTQIVPPISGQYVVIYPTSGSISGITGHCTGTASATSAYLTNFGSKSPITSCSPDGPLATWTGFSLPSYVVATNVTAVYGFQVYGSNGSNTIMQCAGTGGSATLTSPVSSMIQTTGLISGMTGANVPTISCTADFGDSLSRPAGWSSYLNVAAVGLIVYYTGTAPPVGTAVNIVPPLYFNTDTNNLGIDSTALFPASYDSTWTVAAINALSTAELLGNKGLYLVTDGTSGTDCSTGGGSTVLECYWNGTAWTAFSSGGGGGGLTGQTTGYAVEAATATTATGPFPMDDSITTAATITAHKQFAVNDGSGKNGAYTADNGTGNPTPTANLAIYSNDGLGNGYLSENGAAYSRICTAANGECAISTGFPITLGSTLLAASSTTTALTGLSVNGVTLDAAGSATNYLDETGHYSTPAGSGATTHALTMNNSGSGAASGTTFDGSVARTISYNTVGAAASNASTTVNGTTCALGSSCTVSSTSASVDILSLNKPTGTPAYQTNEYASVTSGSTQNILNYSGGDGYVSNLFIALAPGTANSLNDTINMYFNGASTPNISVPLKNLCMSVYEDSSATAAASYFANYAVQWNTNHALNGSSCDFKLPIPFSNSIKIDLINNLGATVTLWSVAEYRIGVPNTWQNTRVLHVDVDNISGVAANAVTTFENYTGGSPGRFVGVFMLNDEFPGSVSVHGASLEGDIALYLDGSGSPNIQSSGAEDWFGTGFYFGATAAAQFAGGGAGSGNANQVASGYGSGERGVTFIGVTQGVTEGAYRFHVLDPITFSSGLKLTIACGNTAQVSFTGTCTQYWTTYYYTQN
jgi:hypothetical protein